MNPDPRLIRWNPDDPTPSAKSRGLFPRSSWMRSVVPRTGRVRFCVIRGSKTGICRGGGIRPKCFRVSDRSTQDPKIAVSGCSCSRRASSSDSRRAHGRSTHSHPSAPRSASSGTSAPNDRQTSCSPSPDGDTTPKFLTSSEYLLVFIRGKHSR